MTTYDAWLRIFELQRYYSWIVDRFHLSTMMHQQKYCGRTYDLRWVEERLRPLGFRIVFCYRSSESFAAARDERLKVSGNPKQYDNMQIFLEEQEDFRILVKRSILPVLSLDVSGGNIQQLSDTIADWMERTNGLYSH